MKVVVIFYSIAILFNWPVDSRKCYECGCDYEWETNTGTCSSAEFLSSCVLKDVGNQYCHMIITYDGTYEQRVFESISANNLQDSHFIQAIEVIALSGAVWLPTAISSIAYGCDWDGCNNISLAQYLPESFQMKIDQTYLNSELINGQLPAQFCQSCSACIHDLTAFVCRQVACTNGICFIDEIHNFITGPTNNCTYNFYSYCDSFTDPPQNPNVRIRATYYIDFDEGKQLQIDEVDMHCTKDNCNSIIVVENLKAQIQANISLHADFRPSRPSDTTTTSAIPTTSSSSTTRTNPSATSTFSTTSTPAPGSKSAKSYPLGILYLIPTLFLLYSS